MLKTTQCSSCHGTGRRTVTHLLEVGDHLRDPRTGATLVIVERMELGASSGFADNWAVVRHPDGRETDVRLTDLAGWQLDSSVLVQSDECQPLT
jgi:hypothetical protein